MGRVTLGIVVFMTYVEAQNMERGRWMTGDLKLPGFMVRRMQGIVGDKPVIINTNCPARKDVALKMFGSSLTEWKNGEEKELDLHEWHGWCDKHRVDAANPLAYILFTAGSKAEGRTFGDRAKNGAVVVIEDTVNLLPFSGTKREVWGNGMWPMEKPKPDEIEDHARLMVSGKPFYVVTAALAIEVGDTDPNGYIDEINAAGVSMTAIPLRYNIPVEYQDKVAKAMIGANRGGLQARTPGVISSASPMMQPYLQIDWRGKFADYMIVPTMRDDLQREADRLSSQLLDQDGKNWVDLHRFYYEIMGHKSGSAMAPAIERTLSGGDPMSLHDAMLNLNDWRESSSSENKLQFAQMMKDVFHMMYPVGRSGVTELKVNTG